MHGSSKVPLKTYGISIAAVAAAVILRWLLDPFLGDTLPLVTLFGAVALAVWIGGWLPAAVAAVLGYAACHYLFIAPRDVVDLAQGDGQTHGSDLYHWAELRGRRLVWVDELPESERIKENSIKNRAPDLELTYNWDPEVYTGGRNFGHLAYKVDNIYDTCKRLMDAGVTINRPPRDGNMAFVKSPDNISIELLQEGDPLPPQEPWLSMPNTGNW